jgi:adenylyltransferase/sulfurtransferase
MSYLLRIAEVYESLALSKEEIRYYARHLLLPGIGTHGQRQLKAARVLVVGAGGLGCPVLQALVGSGVGALTVIDGDCVDVSNLSRQWLHQYVDVGENKAVSAQQKLIGMNPFIQVLALSEMLDAQNADALIAAHDVIVDATDNMEVRYLIDEVCARYNRPWVHAALYRESAQLCVFWEASGARFKALFPERSEAPSCAGAGMLGASASAVANLQALEVIKLITGCGLPQVGTVVSLDSSKLQIQAFKLRGVQPPERIATRGDSLPEHACTVDSLRQRQSIGERLRLIDLRAERQFLSGTIPGAEHMAAELILGDGITRVANERLILFCEHGMVSSLLADALRCHGECSVLHLEGGFSNWEASM